MSTVDQANKIVREIAGMWTTKTPIQRAEAVIEWAAKESLDTRITGRQLVAAMGQQPYFMQGPAEYLDMLLSFTAAMKAA